MELDKIHQGDCLEVLPRLPDNSIDLIFTSPPYADNRKKPYKGVPINPNPPKDTDGRREDRRMGMRELQGEMAWARLG